MAVLLNPCQIQTKEPMRGCQTALLSAGIPITLPCLLTQPLRRFAQFVGRRIELGQLEFVSQAVDLERDHPQNSAPFP